MSGSTAKDVFSYAPKRGLSSLARPLLPIRAMRIALVVAVTLALAASMGCIDDRPGSGHPGAGGQAGGGGNPPWIPPPPSCLRDLVADCGNTGWCYYQDIDDGQLYCFGGGAKATVMTIGHCNLDPQAEPVVTLEMRRGDGSLCYSSEQRCTCADDCATTSRIWRDATERIVARGQVSPTSASVTCEGSGEQCQGPVIGLGPLPCEPIFIPPGEGDTCAPLSCP
jgi:hypothetical protein